MQGSPGGTGPYGNGRGSDGRIECDVTAVQNLPRMQPSARSTLSCYRLFFFSTSLLITCCPWCCEWRVMERAEVKSMLMTDTEWESLLLESERHSVWLTCGLILSGRWSQVVNISSLLHRRKWSIVADCEHFYVYMCTLHKSPLGVRWLPEPNVWFAGGE